MTVDVYSFVMFNVFAFAAMSDAILKSGIKVSTSDFLVLFW